jgi:hypothetical protein
MKKQLPDRECGKGQMETITCYKSQITTQKFYFCPKMSAGFLEADEPSFDL